MAKGIDELHVTEAACEWMEAWDEFYVAKKARETISKDIDDVNTLLKAAEAENYAAATAQRKELNLRICIAEWLKSDRL